jgi:hypothetical protein
VLYSLPDDMRGIAVHLGVDYHAKARGPIVATARWAVPASGEQVERDIEVLMHDRDDVLVASAIVRYRLGPRG